VVPSGPSPPGLSTGYQSQGYQSQVRYRAPACSYICNARNDPPTDPIAQWRGWQQLGTMAELYESIDDGLWIIVRALG